ncbi:MAG: Eco57I restriction-modification methylase domain-containing protein [Thermodesulfobacteriota bacterium]|nr:MAG: Eco57I restriction-modification methylase domain-containing protein [Thermodesulfobacteriota bacterium]
MVQLLERFDTVRKEVGQQTSQKRKAELGQFMTPLTVARFMASLFSPSTLQTARLLDAGAGIGSLSGAFLARAASGGFRFQHIQIVAYEIDASLRKHLSRTLTGYQSGLDVDISVLPSDFIEEAVRCILEGTQRFTHAILNPPYKKINSASRHRLLLRSVGIETVNLYSAFVALTIELMQPGSQVVAIIPRSFCNGPYYRPFRELILAKTAIKHIHLFAARNRAFKDDDVLQENIIILLERATPQGSVTISTSTDDSFTDSEIHIHPFDRIVFPNDPEHFIHIPTSPERNQNEFLSTIQYSLTDLGLEVSTGPVVDFRLKPHLRQMPKPGTVPLLYPRHFSGQSIDWPKQGIKKPNAIRRNQETEKWLYPNGCYVVVRRFSSKEEKRRIVASVVNPEIFSTPMLGFENHLNIFHSRKRGISENLARGLSVFLNSTLVDEQFRRFSGHTQVNATDLRLLKYPSRDALTHLGPWAKKQRDLTQQKIDEKIKKLICQNTKI